MIKAWTGNQIRSAEAPLLANGQGPELMQRAAHGLANAIVRGLLRRRGQVYGSTVAVLAGSGNNGGDALYAGAFLARRGAQATAVLTSARWHTEALAAFRRAGGTVVQAGQAGPALAGELAAADVLVDGILGTGASGGLRGAAAGLVAALQERISRPTNGTGPLVVACDLPSGVDADTGQLHQPVLRADLTVTFGGAKLGLLTDPGAGAAGRVWTVDIGLGPHLPEPALRRLDPGDVPALWPVPGRSDHKYTRGVLGIAAGSASYHGAALLAARAAVATGVGMVRYLGPGEICGQLNLLAPEVVCGSGTIAENRSQAWLVGPGAVADPEQAQRAREALASGLPVVADAGALDLLPAELGPHVILTPHAGELVRVLAGQGVSVDREQVEASPAEFARLAAGLTGATVLLKGAATVVASPAGTLFSQDNATAWMATAGSGDTLAGILGALAATVRPQDLDRAGIAAPDHFAAVAALAALVHGLAGTAAAAGGPTSAAAIGHAVPAVVRALLREPEQRPGR
ncbi:bifunctional ADP-dependent NAD(P)H-hydrate dehydratase/NAD(P)H-hydrate epimerase [Arthrobacter sp. I2-34]|uniref:Bifunctional NAD(P)H-hydrate repair enzyme n=1 Tax=Arthrobacter hankyongi TaxID=2904801 RepID=A0ABS9L537_9MICC|nr:bifunctional ADP-dependent NAD(P)H-hydrate dehydratase/NAD(P)H-hydrate epimerase [Arthrobacter hankyongi]MCG2621688.1 bifunctional ADP-dependent NAD(P)H-hydrate dehydratase/NAD(P)H-hydrate epimerase [Arthrobacter hankyongi]